MGKIVLVLLGWVTLIGISVEAKGKDCKFDCLSSDLDCTSRGGKVVSKICDTGICCKFPKCNKFQDQKCTKKCKKGKQMPDFRCDKKKKKTCCKETDPCADQADHKCVKKGTCTKPNNQTDDFYCKKKRECCKYPKDSCEGQKDPHATFTCVTNGTCKGTESSSYSCPNDGDICCKADRKNECFLKGFECVTKGTCKSSSKVKHYCPLDDETQAERECCKSDCSEASDDYMCAAVKHCAVNVTEPNTDCLNDDKHICCKQLYCKEQKGKQCGPADEGTLFKNCCPEDYEVLGDECKPRKDCCCKKKTSSTGLPR